jgi:acylphosphatase
MSEKTNIHAFVSGRVQGVFFRASLAREAKRLQLTGFVRNLHDGRVEFLAFGAQTQINALKRWSYTGSPAANVSGVEIVEYTGPDDYDAFSIMY